jgi:hypothetical protein
MFEVKMLSYDELTKEEQEDQYHDPYDSVNYIRVKHEGKVILLESDQMEPEDTKFYRDLSWIPGIIEKAYKLGRLDWMAEEAKDAKS